MVCGLQRLRSVSNLPDVERTCATPTVPRPGPVDLASSRTSTRARLREIASALSLGAVSLLVAFHVWLLALRLVEGRLGEPIVALRWLAALLLITTLASLRRAGVPLVWGRKAFAFWVLVVVLHWTVTPAAERGVPVEELLLTLPGTVVTLAAFALLAVAGGRSVRPHARTAREERVGVLWLGPVANGFLPTLAARPPPA